MSDVENALENIIGKEDSRYAEDAVRKKEKENNVTAEEKEGSNGETLANTEKERK